MWPNIEAQLTPLENSAAALILEPVLQGGGGMKIVSPDLLRHLRKWCDAHGVYFIADEILTGLGRTGKALACEHAGIQADFICLAKGLTAGVLPLSAVLTTDVIYDLFYDDYHTGKAFLHSHTHTGNALAVAVANKVLEILERDHIYEHVESRNTQLWQYMETVAERTQCLTNIRGVGGLIAADLVLDDPNNRMGFSIYQQAVKLGALLRPLGNTIYWLPPLNASETTLLALRDITIQAIKKTSSCF